MTHVERFDKEVGLDQESAASWRARWEAEQKDRDANEQKFPPAPDEPIAAEQLEKLDDLTDLLREAEADNEQ